MGEENGNDIKETIVDATQLVKDYVQAVLAYEDTEDETVYEKCETIWLKMVEFTKASQ